MVDVPDNHTAAAAAAAGSSTMGISPTQEVQEPSFKQLMRVGMTSALPFVAFGFFDNMIMVGVVWP